MKTIRSFIIPLTLLLLLSGCRESYLAEKEFFKASKVLATIKASDIKAHGLQVYDPAIEAFEHVVEKYPGTPKAVESLFLISHLRASQKNFDKARTALEKVVQNSANRASTARLTIAQLYEREGRWKDAEAAYWETAQYHSLDINGLYAPIQIILHYKKLGDVVGRDKAYRKALDHYNKVLEQSGPIQASAMVRNYLALAYFSNDEWERAKQEWLSLAKDMPENSYAPLSLLAAAELSQQKADIPTAIKIYRDYLQQYPKHALAGKTAVSLGLLYEDRKEFAEARQWFEKALTQYFTKNKAQAADIKLLIGKSYQDEGRWSDAERIYREIETQYPMTVAALQVPFMAHLHYESIGQKEKAKEILDSAINHYKELATQYSGTKLERYVRSFINSAYAKQGNWNQVLSSIDEEIKREKRPIRQGRWLILKALIAEKQLQDKEKALSLYRDFLTRYPEHPLARAAKMHQQILAQQ